MHGYYKVAGIVNLLAVKQINCSNTLQLKKGTVTVSAECQPKQTE